MPGKYSYNAVLSDYSSQGLIPLPNDKEIDFQRDSSTPRPSKRAGRQSTGQDAFDPSSPASLGRRVVIQDSDSDDDHVRTRPRPARASSPAPNKSIQRTEPVKPPERRPQTQRAQHAKTVKTKSSLPSAPAETSSESRRSGGVKAFMAARYQQEVGGRTQDNDISLHEFLDSVPRSPERTKKQPREAHLMLPRTSHVQNDHEISVMDFLDQVPSPPAKGDMPKSKDEARPPPKSPNVQPSSRVSRLPKGVELPARPRNHGPSAKDSRKPPQARVASEIQPRRSTQEQTRRRTLLAEAEMVRKVTAALAPQQAAADRKFIPSTPPEQNVDRKHQLETSAVKTPRQEPLDQEYDLNFEGFADEETSYFPSMGSAMPSASRPVRVDSLKTSVARSTTPQSMLSSQTTSSRHAKPGKVKSITGPPAAQTARASNLATPPITPRDAVFPTGSPLSPTRDSTTTYERTMQSLQPLNAALKKRTSASWSLPPIKQSGEESDGFSDMFKTTNQSSKNILIFTSDEEEEADVDDDVPTPQLQKLVEDVRFPSTEWGMISAGKNFTPGSRDPDSMSDLSAVYPPDIGRKHGGKDYDSPLAVTLQNMRHGGELGQAYKPQQSRFAFRKPAKTTQILGKLGLRRTSSVSDKHSIVGSSMNGKSRPKERPAFHPSLSSQARLPTAKR
jgi:hypothetical protein